MIRIVAANLPPLLTGLLLAAAAITTPSRAVTAEVPNIILIVADDLGYGDLGCYGAPDVHTPVLDQLARDGCRFTSFYSNGPECSPTRAALFSGRYQHRIGGLECAIGTHNVGRYDDAIRLAEAHQLGLPVEHNSLSLPLRDAGYACGLFGKWHLGYEPHFLPVRHGFEKSFGVLGGNADYFRHTEDDGWNTLFEDDQLTTRDGYLTDLITDAALAWRHSIKAGDRPFFLYVPYTCPHTPIQLPEDRGADLVSSDDWNKGTREEYAAMIEHMDRQIGRILAAVDADGLRDETLVIFMSDNGGTRLGRNSPFKGHKSTTYEGGIRVPCIVRWPGRIPSGRVVDHPAITMDLTHSLVRISGAAAADDRPFDGIDILAAVESDTVPAARTLYWRGRRGDRTWRAVRDGNLKGIWMSDGQDSKAELYDLQSDPGESKDLAAARPEELRRLEGLLRKWEQEVEPRR
jgi:N-acetylgalactosamine-6-sulfatase